MESVTVNDRIDTLKETFSTFSSWEDKYRHIIEMGKSLPEMKEEYKIEANKVKGCQSQVWLHAELDGDKVIFYADSDASIVKGIISVLLSVYSKLSPKEILEIKPEFVDEIGLRQHLSMSRANGLSAMLKQISLYALAFKTKLDMMK